VIELVRIVRNQDELGRRDRGAFRPGEPQVERVRVAAEQVGQHGRRRAELGLAVLGGLHHLRVQAERRVVHEHPAVDRGQVDRALDPVAEGLERADHVVAVQAQVQGEVVPGPGRDADVRDAAAAGHGRDQRLRAVAAGHADHVGAPVDRVVGQFEQVFPGPQDHGLDAAPRALLGQPEPLGLPAPGLQVHDQDGMARGRDPDQPVPSYPPLVAGPAQGVAGGQHRQDRRREQQDHVAQAEVLRRQPRAQQRHGCEHDDQADGADGSPPGHRVPARGHEDHCADDRGQHRPEVQHHAGQQQHHGGRQGEQRHHGRGALADRRALPGDGLGHAVSLRRVIRWRHGAPSGPVPYHPPRVGRGGPPRYGLSRTHHSAGKEEAMPDLIAIGYPRAPAAECGAGTAPRA